MDDYVSIFEKYAYTLLMSIENEGHERAVRGKYSTAVI